MSVHLANVQSVKVWVVKGHTYFKTVKKSEQYTLPKCIEVFLCWIVFYYRSGYVLVFTPVLKVFLFCYKKKCELVFMLLSRNKHIIHI